MDLATYAVEAVVEETHWWFVGRRQLFAAMLRRLGVSRDAEVLDIGTSTGTNLRLLNELGFRRVKGVDNSEAAIAFSASKNLGVVELGDACALPFANDRFDFIFATDVIEHVDRDDLALSEIHRVLKPGGTALITVPAFQSLWGLQDDASFHKRRYRIRQLRDRIGASGLKVADSFYFNYLLFAPIWMARRLINLLGIELASENQVNSPLINRILTRMFELDVRTAPRLRPPFGVSILAIANK